MNENKLVHIILGPLLFFTCLVILPSSIFSNITMKAAIGAVIWLAYWWVTKPVDLAVTALIPIAINSIIEIIPMNSLISNYSSETIVLLFSSSILAVSMSKTGLDKRIASAFLSIIGDNFRTQLLFWFLLSTILSSVLPNAVVCSTITPIAVSMLRYVGEADIKNSKIGSKLLLYIAYGVGIGGLFSPLGGAMNLVSIDYLQQITGKEFTYYIWEIVFFPIIVVLLISNIIFMLRDVKKEDSLPGSKEYFIMEYKKLSPMSKEEKISLFLFGVATVLSFTRPIYQNVLPYLKPAYVFTICAIFSFFITNKNNERMMKWSEVQGNIVWELIFVFAGGLAAGALINGSGTAEVIGTLVSKIGLTGGYLTVLIIITMTLLMSDVTSNTATASIAIPIVISIVKGLNLNPVPWIYISTIGVNISYMLPTSIRAIPVGYGLEPKYMLKEGWKLSLIVIVLTSIVSYFLLKYWPLFIVAY